MNTTEKKKRHGLFYSRGEETVNSISHGIGIAMGVVFGTLFLLKCHQIQDPWATFGIWLYLFGMGGSYIASTLYHAMKHHSPWKRRLRHWDHCGQLLTHHTHRPSGRSRLGMGTVRLRLVLRNYRYNRQLPQDGRTQSHRNRVLHCHGIVHTGCFQSTVCHCRNFLLLDYCRRSLLHHRNAILLFPPHTLHAFSLPFLRIGRFSVPSGSDMVCAGDAIAALKHVNNHLQSLLFCFTSHTFVVLYTSATLQQDDTDREFKLWLQA